MTFVIANINQFLSLALINLVSQALFGRFFNPICGFGVILRGGNHTRSVDISGFKPLLARKRDLPN